MAYLGRSILCREFPFGPDACVSLVEINPLSGFQEVDSLRDEDTRVHL